jgi:hypothetical protein
VNKEGISQVSITAVGVVNPPDQKLVLYISVNCKKGINSPSKYFTLAQKLGKKPV